MYPAVPKTIWPNGRNRATVRDGDDITAPVASRTANPCAKSTTGKPTRPTPRSAAR
jgi:hypothetical protein